MLHNGVWFDGNNDPLIHGFIGTARPEPPEIHSGKLPASHMDLACQLGLEVPAWTVKSYVKRYMSDPEGLLRPELHVHRLEVARYLLTLIRASSDQKHA
jgi:hypothetical protein